MTGEGAPNPVESFTPRIMILPVLRRTMASKAAPQRSWTSRVRWTPLKKKNKQRAG